MKCGETMQMYMLSSDLKTSISVSWSGSALLLMEISLRYSLQLTENPLTSTDTRLAIALAWPGESISRPSALTSQFQVYLPLGQCPFRLAQCLQCESANRRFQLGEGPSRRLSVNTNLHVDHCFKLYYPPGLGPA